MLTAAGQALGSFAREKLQFLEDFRGSWVPLDFLRAGFLRASEGARRAMCPGCPGPTVPSTPRATARAPTMPGLSMVGSPCVWTGAVRERRTRRQRRAGAQSIIGTNAKESRCSPPGARHQRSGARAKVGMGSRSGWSVCAVGIDAVDGSKRGGGAGHASSRGLFYRAAANSHIANHCECSIGHHENRNRGVACALMVAARAGLRRDAAQLEAISELAAVP